MSNQQEPSRYLQKVALKLFAEESARSTFYSALQNPQPYPEAILWLTEKPSDYPFECAERLPWQVDFVDRLPRGQRPGAHELHQSGAYYCLDYSSVFAAQVLAEIECEHPLVLDLCAAPGGKAIFAFRMLQPELLICNETIGKRIGALTSNLKRCHIQPSIVTNRDPRVLAEQFDQGADVVIVDAPCSGQSLLTKGKESGGCFHPATINLNKNRQRRIIAEASRMVAPGGYLAYMTCTFSVEENEEIAKWFMKKFSSFSAVEVKSHEPYQSALADFPCYRLLPQSGLGAGSFSVLFKNNQPGERLQYRLKDLPISWSNPESLRE